MENYDFKLFEENLNNEETWKKDVDIHIAASKSIGLKERIKESNRKTWVNDGGQQEDGVQKSDPRI